MTLWDAVPQKFHKNYSCFHLSLFISCKKNLIPSQQFFNRIFFSSALCFNRIQITEFKSLADRHSARRSLKMSQKTTRKLLCFCGNHGKKKSDSEVVQKKNLIIYILIWFSNFLYSYYVRVDQM